MPGDVLFLTERLRAAPWRDDHADVAYSAYSDPEFVRYLGAGRQHESVEYTRAWLGRIRASQDTRTGRSGFWALELIDTAELVGATICQSLPGGDGEYEIGWHVFPAHQHKGYATESGAGAAAYAFDVLGLNEVFAFVEPGNTASIAVAHRLGMQHLGRTTKFYDGVEGELFRLVRRSPGEREMGDAGR